MAVQSQQIASLYAKVSVNVKDATTGLRDMRERLGQTTNNLKTMRDQAKISGAAVTALLAAPIALLGKSALESIGDYQKAMNVFQLVTQASGDQMAQASAAIEALAHDMALPQFTKPQVADALLELARAGLGAQGAVEALRPALLLAAAGEVSAGEGAQLMAAALNTWHLSAQQAGATADMLAATMKFAGINFDQLRNTVEVAGSTFASAHVPLDTFLTLVAELGKQGIKGSEAGTALRNMLQSLIAPTTDANGLLKGLGVHVYDATNTMRPLRDVIGELHDAFARLTPAQQEQYAATIFGRDAMGSALQIIRGGLPAYDDMHAQVTRVGIAQELAQTKAEGLSGATANLTREVQNASTSAWEPLAPSLAVIAKALADVLVWFQTLPAPVREIVGAVGLALPVLGALELAWLAIGPAIGAVIAVAGPIATVLEALGVVVGGIAVGPISLLILAVGGLALALKWAYDNVAPFHDAVDATFRAIDGLARQAGDAITHLNDALRAVFGVRIDFGAIFQNIPIVSQIIDIWNRLKGLGLLPGVSGSMPVVTVGGGGGGAQGFVGGVPIPARAGGGAVMAGSSYMVGEQGPELFTPNRSGAVVPNGALAGGGTQVNFYGPVFGFDDFQDQVARAMDLAGRRGRS